MRPEDYKQDYFDRLQMRNDLMASILSNKHISNLLSGNPLVPEQEPKRRSSVVEDYLKRKGINND